MPDLPPNEMADQNLRRVCAVTGARYLPDHSAWSPMNSSTYLGPWVHLVIGPVQYYISAGYICRRIGVTFDGTCFYSFPPGAEIPNAEQIAMAILLLRNNPGIFELWKRHDGAYA